MGVIVTWIPCWTLVTSILAVLIIVFYTLKNGKIIDSGTSSLILRHGVLLNTHAEEIALKRIKRIHSRKYKIKDLRIIIWKQNNHGLVKPIDCCKWCTKLIQRYSFPMDQVLTFNREFDDNSDFGVRENILKSAISSEPVVPLCKCLRDSKL